jgi:hypothetical protein
MRNAKLDLRGGLVKNKAGAVHEGKTLAIAFVVLSLSTIAFAASAPQSGMETTVDSVLIYSNNMAYVTSVGTAHAPKEGNAFFRAENFTNNAILGTLRTQDADGTVFWAKRYYDETIKPVKTERYLSFDELLNASYGKAITVQNGGKEIQGTLMWVQNGMVGVKAADGKLVVSTPDRVDLPPSETRKNEEMNTTTYERGLELFIGGAREGQHTVKMSYLSTGADWAPTYNLEVEGSEIKGEGKLSALAEISNNADEDWKNVAMRVAVGSPYFVEGNSYAPSPYRNYALENKAMQTSFAMDSGAGGAPSVSGQALGTQYIYSLSEPVTLKKGERANFQLFSSGATYERDNVWEGYGAVEQVMRVKNSAGKPFAPGVMRVYEDGAFTGEGMIDYTGVSREVEAKYAALPQISVKKETNRTAENQIFDRKETTYTVSMKVESSALEAKPLTLRDTMAYGDLVELVSSSVPVKQLSDNRLEWKLTVPSGANLTVAYVYKVTNFDSRYY